MSHINSWPVYSNLFSPTPSFSLNQGLAIYGLESDGFNGLEAGGLCPHCPAAEQLGLWWKGGLCPCHREKQWQCPGPSAVIPDYYQETLPNLAEIVVSFPGT